MNTMQSVNMTQYEPYAMAYPALVLQFCVENISMVDCREVGRRGKKVYLLCPACS